MSVKWWTISSQRETIEGSAAIAAFFSQIYFMAFYVANNSVTNCQSCFIAFYVANYSVTELLYTAFPSSIHPKCREMMRTKFLLPKMLLSPKTFIFTTLSRSFYNSCNVFICQFKQINHFTPTDVVGVVGFHLQSLLCEASEIHLNYCYFLIIFEIAFFFTVIFSR